MSTLGPTALPVDVLTPLPADLLTSIFDYFVDDYETLECLTGAYPDLASPVDIVRHSTRTVLVRGNGAQEACKELAKSLRPSRNVAQSNSTSKNDSKNTLIGPIRYLELIFDSRPEFDLADATQKVLDRLPAVRHVTLKINASPFPDHPSLEMIPGLERKVRGAVQDYSTLMDMLNTLKPHRKIGLSLVLNDCMLRSSPIIAQPYPNIVLREFDIKCYCCKPTMMADMKRIVHALKTITHITIREDPKDGWQYPQSPRTSFRGATALKGLSIPASLWFSEASVGGHGCEGAQGFLWQRKGIRPSIVDLIPPSLSSLRVEFIGGAAIFAVGMGYHAAVANLTSVDAKMKMRPAWDWIYQLAVAVHQKRRPYLKDVAVLELNRSPSGREARAGRDTADASVQWDPPLLLKSAFEQTGVKLRIQTRGERVVILRKRERERRKDDSEMETW